MSDGDMVDRVARALVDGGFLGVSLAFTAPVDNDTATIRALREADTANALAAARAAIEAMREPTEAMYDAGQREISHFDGEYGDYNVEFSVQQIDRLWPVMIDAALNTGETE